LELVAGFQDFGEDVAGGDEGDRGVKK